MPKHYRAKRSTNIIRKKQSDMSRQSSLSKYVRDELRMTCALQGFSAMRQEGEKTLKKQAEFMNDFFHGVEGKRPSQIKMVAEGTSIYKELYETSIKTVVNKKKKGNAKSKSVTRRRLKDTLTRTEGILYYIGSDITHSDLEKK